MSLPDSAEYWWDIRGKSVTDLDRNVDIVAKNKRKKANYKIRKDFKKRYPHLSHTDISLLAQKNKGYLNIAGKNINDLIQ
jgi:hypothetical protein